MQRLLVNVLKVKRKRQYKNEEGLHYSQVECLVKVKGMARKSLRLPKKVKGKKTEVLRECLLPWEVKPGDYLVLDPEETKRVIAEQIPPTPSQRVEQPNVPQPLLYSQDTNGDGFKENILENSFLKAVVAPHYGARLWELWTKGVNHLFGRGNYDKNGYVELGGVEESVSGMGKPDELWNANYIRGRSERQPLFNYHFSFKEKEGLEANKKVGIEPGAPIISQVFQFTYKGKGKKPKENTSINFCAKVFFAMGGEANFHNLFFIPTKEKLIKVRYHPPAWSGRWDEGMWDWRQMHHGIKPGFILLTNEVKKDTLAILFHPKKISFAWTGTNSRSPRIFLSHSLQKLRKGGKASYGLLYIPADAFDLNQRSLLLLSLGESSSAGRPMAITFRSRRKYKECAVDLKIDGEERKLPLERKVFPEVGEIFFQSLTLPKDFSSVSVYLSKARESLRCQLKGGER